MHLLLRSFTWAGLLMLSAIGLHAQQLGEDLGKKSRFTLAITPGFQQENVAWSIAGNLQGQKPTIYSELCWRNLRGPQLAADGKWRIWQQLFLQIRFTNTFIVAGTVTDTDYQNDNRTNPSFYAKLPSDRGQSTSLMAGLGYTFTGNDRYYISPSVGYGLNKQLLFVLAPGIHHALQTTYRTSWQGPFIKVEGGILLAGKWTVSSLLNYHQLTYQGTGNWTLIEEFQHPVSFRHMAKGYGVETALKVSLKVNSSVAADLVGNYLHWSTGAGIDELYLATGTTTKTRLNDATRHGFGAGLGIRLSF